jgi:hypothetical protein
MKKISVPKPPEELVYLEQIEILIPLGFELLKIIEKHEPKEGKYLIAVGFLRKAVRILLAIRTLVHQGLEEEAQILCRALIETYINFDYFLKLAKDNFEKAFARIIDSIMLQKKKALESVNYTFGERLISKEDWDRIEAEIKSRYSETDFRDLKRYGFSGISLESRARRTGNIQWYNCAYRLYSKHAHGTDFDEHLQSVLVPESVLRYGRSRILALLQASFTCALRTVCKCNDWLGRLIKLPVELEVK